MAASRRRAPLGALTTLVLAACASRASAQAQLPDGFSDQTVVSQLSQPVGMAFMPDGRLLFVEHGLAPEENVRKWQHRLTPIWKRIGGGCHLNRPIPALIETAGFDVGEIKAGYIRGPKPMTYIYEGRARP